MGDIVSVPYVRTYVRAYACMYVRMYIRTYVYSPFVFALATSFIIQFRDNFTLKLGIAFQCDVVEGKVVEAIFYRKTLSSL